MLREFRLGRMTSEQVFKIVSKIVCCYVLNVVDLGVHLGLACDCGRGEGGRGLGGEADLDAPGLQSICCRAEHVFQHSRQGQAI